MTIRFRLHGKVWVYRGRRRRQPAAHQGRVIDLVEYRRRREAELLKRRRGPQGVA